MRRAHQAAPNLPPALIPCLWAVVAEAVEVASVAEERPPPGQQPHLQLQLYLQICMWRGLQAH